MNFSKKQIAVFKLERDKGTLYSNMLKNPLTFQFSEGVVNNLELVSREKLHKAIRLIVNENKIKPSKIAIVLDESVIFEEYIENPKEFENVEIEKFLDTIPFRHLVSKTFKRDNKVRIIATNLALCEGIAEVFEEEGFFVTSLIPVSILYEVLPKTKKEFDVQRIFKKIDSLKQYSMLYFPENQSKFITDTKSRFMSLRLFSLF